MSTSRDRNYIDAAEKIKAKKLELEDRCEKDPGQLREALKEFAAFSTDLCISTIVTSAIEDAVLSIARPA